MLIIGERKESADKKTSLNSVREFSYLFNLNTILERIMAKVLFLQKTIKSLASKT